MVALTCCVISFLQIFPIRRKGALIQQRLFSFEEKRSIVCGPHLISNQLKYEQQMDQSFGIDILEISFAKALDSRGTHSTEIVILCKSQNQNSSRAKVFKGSLGLPLLIIPRRFIASTCKTTNFPLHLLRSACKHRLTPNNSRYVEDWMASHGEKYSCATYVTPLRGAHVWRPRIASIAKAKSGETT